MINIKIIDKNKICRCNKCDIILQYDESDLKTDSAIYGVLKPFSILFVRCPVCKSRIDIRKIYIKK